MAEAGMTNWFWWAGNYADVEYEGVYPLGEFTSRDEAIAAAIAEGVEETSEGCLFFVIEARSSTVEQEDPDYPVPFLATRNRQLFNLIDGVAEPA